MSYIQLCVNTLLVVVIVKEIYQFYWFHAFLTSQDLEKMRIGTIHRNKIWRALVEYRQSNNLGTSQADPTAPDDVIGSGESTVKASLSNASTISAHAGPESSGSSTNPTSSQGYCPGFYEVTRYTFKHNLSIKKEDHDYCDVTNKWGLYTNY